MGDTWLVPNDAEKPEDGRYKKVTKMGNNMEDRQTNMIESFQSLFGKEELLAKVIGCFPYPIEIYAPDGTSVLVNKAMLAEYHAISPDMVVG